MKKKQLGLFTVLGLGVAIFATDALTTFAANNSEAQKEEAVKLVESDVSETVKVNPEFEGKFTVEVDDEGADFSVIIKEETQTSTSHKNAQSSEPVLTETVEVNQDPEVTYSLEIDQEALTSTVPMTK